MNVGQKVVCVKAHSLGAVTIGQTYTIQSTIDHICGRRHLDVGIVLPFDGGAFCPFSQTTILGSVWWIDSSLFAPIVSTPEVNREEVGTTTFEDVMAWMEMAGEMR